MLFPKIWHCLNRGMAVTGIMPAQHETVSPHIHHSFNPWPLSSSRYDSIIVTCTAQGTAHR
jgi:hypothetical protein